MDIKEATKRWVDEFSFINQTILQHAVGDDFSSWVDLTRNIITVEDRVYYDGEDWEVLEVLENDELKVYIEGDKTGLDKISAGEIINITGSYGYINDGEYKIDSVFYNSSEYRTEITLDSSYNKLGLSVTSVDTGSNTVSIPGDYKKIFGESLSFDIYGSSGNDSSYTVKSSSYDGSDTVITVNENISDSTADGRVGITGQSYGSLAYGSTGASDVSSTLYVQKVTVELGPLAGAPTKEDVMTSPGRITFAGIIKSGQNPVFNVTGQQISSIEIEGDGITNTYEKCRCLGSGIEEAGVDGYNTVYQGEMTFEFRKAPGTELESDTFVSNREIIQDRKVLEDYIVDNGVPKIKMTKYVREKSVTTYGKYVYEDDPSYPISVGFYDDVSKAGVIMKGGIYLKTYTTFDLGDWSDEDSWTMEV